MKKTFEQPELMVVRANNDIVTASETLGVKGNYSGNGSDALAPGRRRSIWN